MADVVSFGEAMLELSGLEPERCRLSIAGDTFNTAVYLARAGISVAYATAIGACPFSQRLTQALQAEGIATDLVARVPDRALGVYAIELDEDGERSFTYWRSESAVRALFSSAKAETVRSALLETKLLYLSGITLSLYTEDVRDELLRVLEKRKTEGLCTVFDPNYRPRNWSSAAVAQAAMERATSLATWSLPTFDDEAALFGDASPEATADRHRALGADEVIVKHGAKGAFIAETGWVAPQTVVTPTDTTGAGDSFNAAYIAAQLTGADKTTSVRFGHQLAAKVLSVSGALLPRNS
ncbi:MAG: sugar kinase [Pseudomonadota bacterium]